MTVVDKITEAELTAVLYRPYDVMSKNLILRAVFV